MKIVSIRDKRTKRRQSKKKTGNHETLKFIGCPFFCYVQDCVLFVILLIDVLLIEHILNLLTHGLGHGQIMGRGL